MELLTKELIATAIVSVAHRPELEVFHDRKITLKRERGATPFFIKAGQAHRRKETST
jgi:ABC-type uncharacterized transport system fused permease/ATPase subunit